MHVNADIQSLEGGVRPPGAGVTGSCEPPRFSAGKQMRSYVGAVHALNCAAFLRSSSLILDPQITKRIGGFHLLCSEAAMIPPLTAEVIPDRVIV